MYQEQADDGRVRLVGNGVVECESAGVREGGKTVLYPLVSGNYPFKTSDRLLDDIRSTLSFVLEGVRGNGVLKSPMLDYSKERGELRAWSIGYLLDQVLLQTSYEYASLGGSGGGGGDKHSKINVFMGLLCDPMVKLCSEDDIVNYSGYHLRVTVKTRLHLERAKRQFGIAQYHLVNDLHPADKQDLCFFEDDDECVIDSATYVSSGTNRLVRIEILKPEFTAEEWSEFTPDSIRKRYLSICEKYPDLNRENVPNQAECLNTLFKVFKNPLSRQDSDDELKTISAENKVLNSQLDPNWLVDKFGFELCEVQEEDGRKEYEYKPPDFTNYVNDWNVRHLRERYIRKSLELLFVGKQSIRLLPKEVVAASSKLRSFQLYQTHFSHTFWFQLLGEFDRNDFNQQQQHPYDTNPHFINLSVNYYYGDRDIIRNYESQILLDPKNAGIYYDDLTFIANVKGSHQLLTFTLKQNIVGQEALNSALRLFHIDPSETDPKQIPDEMLLSCYKEECKYGNTRQHADLRNALRLLAKYKQSEKLKFYVELEPFQQESQAYSILEIDESVDIDIIETAYTIKVSDAPGLKVDCDRALYTLAIAKRSMDLFNYLLQRCPRFQQFYHISYWSYTSALQYLQVNVNATDDLILEIFRRKWAEEPVISPDQFLNLKVALMKIAHERNSKLINHFLETGIIDTNYLTSGNWPTGLNNIGNTCYLNSLLQYYFTISPLRDYIQNYEDTASDLLLNMNQSGAMTKRRIGGRAVNKPEVERSVQFVYQLRDLFNDMAHSKERCVTPSRELAYLSFSPSTTNVEFESAAQVPFRDTTILLEQEPPNEDTEVFDISIEGSNVETEAAAEDIIADDNIDTKDESSSLSPSTSTSSSQKGNSMSNIVEENEPITSTCVAKISPDQLENTLEIGRQQDVTECIGNVLYQIESASVPLNFDEGHEQYDLVKQLFYGKLKQDLIPIENPEKRRTKFERFMSLLVNVGDHPKDIYDALDLYFRDDLLALGDDNARVRRSVAVEELPTILQIQIQRVYYDREKLMPFKSTEPLPFGEKLYMDRYMASTESELLAKKQESLQLHETLEAIKQRRKKILSKNDAGLTLKDSLKETKIFLESSVLAESEGKIRIEKRNLIKQLDSFSLEIDKELSNLDDKIKDMENSISHKFDQFTNFGYNLFAVFIHRGEASYGHYWVYIKDRKNSGIWRKYNDESVTEVPESEVFDFTEDNTATPYFLVYIKDGHEHEIEPLKVYQ
ncbi:ubiquitin-specific protease UBP2 Ecym_4514 [Eremothecium cymbalariae DBVPG|uniref:Ubiquitin carboxyl-terminal hydrolase 2 n=1 Tax=Eremothecium cymbalariae (strain CBS 270.75 / DBVPG 7215 / KCTC 17166 / NRRL Y-17582) TaxID=931890 RepID=G8JU48_ERECY|nr:hypothetical protein Ecym_4514 [Eremothecium cymbalariae DBVPG\